MSIELMTPCEIERKKRNEAIVFAYRNNRKKFDYKVSDDRIYRMLAGKFKVTKETIRRVVNESQL